MIFPRICSDNGKLLPRAAEVATFFTQITLNSWPTLKVDRVKQGSLGGEGAKSTQSRHCSHSLPHGLLASTACAAAAAKLLNKSKSKSNSKSPTLKPSQLPSKVPIALPQQLAMEQVQSKGARKEDEVTPPHKCYWCAFNWGLYVWARERQGMIVRERQIEHIHVCCCQLKELAASSPLPSTHVSVFRLVCLSRCMSNHLTHNEILLRTGTLTGIRAMCQANQNGQIDGPKNANKSCSCYRSFSSLS